MLKNKSELKPSEQHYHVKKVKNQMASGDESQF